jgi:hypothetical protein
MKALISPQENNRIVEVKANNRTFPIAEPLYWADCPDGCTTQWTYVDSQFVEPAQTSNELSNDEKLAYIRAERDKRLLACDFTQLQDVILLNGEQLTNQWQIYRQALRDMINEQLDLDNPNFPILPQ